MELIRKWQRFRNMQGPVSYTHLDVYKRQVYMEQHPDTAVVQMDYVIGSKGGKVLLTIYFVNVSLMLGFLREANTSKSVIDIYDELYHRLGGQDFRKLFPVILTDNGSEFSNPKCIENGPDGKGFQRTRIYYCNPCLLYTF